MSEETEINETVEKEPVTVPTPKTLEEKLIEFYEAQPSGARFNIRVLAEQVGASEQDVSLAWHRLHDEGVFKSPELLKPE